MVEDGDFAGAGGGDGSAVLAGGAGEDGDGVILRVEVAETLIVAGAVFGITFVDVEAVRSAVGICEDTVFQEVVVIDGIPAGDSVGARGGAANDEVEMIIGNAIAVVGLIISDGGDETR